MYRYQLIITLLLLSIGFIGCSEQSSVRPPFKSINNLVYQTTFESSNGDTLAIGNGTQLLIPKNAWVNSEGIALSGEITLQYTEIQNVTQQLISGIPMKFGENTNPQIMESASMFKIAATANGSPAELAEGSTIQTIISSDIDGEEYELYQFDSLGGTWNNLAKVTPYENPAIVAMNKKIATATAEQRAMSLENCFALNYLEELDIYDDKSKLKDKRFNYYTYDGVPSFKTLKNIVKEKVNNYGATFIDTRGYQEVYFNGKSYNPNLVLWESEKKIPSRLKKSDLTWPEIKPLGKGKYYFTFSRFTENYKREIIFGTAATIKTPLSTLYSSQPSERSARYDSLVQVAEDQKVLMLAQQKVLRAFNINQMGVYNYDIIKDEQRLLVKAKLFLDEKELDPNLDLFVINKGRNSVIRYAPDQLDHFVIYPDQELIAFMVMSENRLAVLEKGSLENLDLRALKATEDPLVIIKLQMSDHVIADISDVTLFLETELGAKPEILSYN